MAPAVEMIAAMGIEHFNEDWLIAELERLSSSFRVLFAAASAQRLLSAYLRFSRLTGRGDAPLLTAILDRLWQDIQGDRMDQHQLKKNIQISTQLIPDEDSNPWSAQQAQAEDAAAAVAYALRCRQNGQAKEAAWAARRVYEALNYFVVEQDMIDVNQIGAEEKVVSHPLIQAELSRQRRDLRDLSMMNEQDVTFVARRMRDQAQAESEIIFKPELR